MTKKEIRRIALQRRENLSDEERGEGARKITEQIAGHPLYRESSVVLLFIGYGSEISTSGIVDDALKKGKKVFAPRVTGPGTMEYFSITGTLDLQAGYMGIPEPKEDLPTLDRAALQAEETFVLFPGVAFDTAKHRIGYGKGFYDRYFADRQDLLLRSVAVGFSCQLFPEIPFEENDLKPAEVILV